MDAPGAREGSWSEHLVAVVVVVGLLAAVALLGVSLAPAPDRVDRFDTSAGTRVRVECWCLGLPCSHRVFLELPVTVPGPAIEVADLDPVLADPEACVFGEARVRWSRNDGAMRFAVPTRHGLRRGTIALP